MTAPEARPKHVGPGLFLAPLSVVGAKTVNRFNGSNLYSCRRFESDCCSPPAGFRRSAERDDERRHPGTGTECGSLAFWNDERGTYDL
jgi:hypothetical protein